jgi:hypothetical protein
MPSSIAARAALIESSMDCALRFCSNSPSSDPARNLTAPAMAIGSNPLSSTRKSARATVGSVFQEFFEVLMG